MGPELIWKQVWLLDAPGMFLGSPLMAKKALWRAPDMWPGALRWARSQKGWFQFCHLSKGSECSPSWSSPSLLKLESRCLTNFQREKKVWNIFSQFFITL